MPLLLNVDVTGRHVLVVGCGPAGREKVERLLAAGAHVRVVDPQPPGDLDPAVEVAARHFEPGDTAGAWLVVAATGDPSIDDRVQAAAEASTTWVTRADRRDGGGVSFAATVERPPVVIGVTTGGASPALARWLRDRIARAVPEEVGALAHLLARRPRRDGRRGHQDVPFDDALDALVRGDDEASRRLVNGPARHGEP
ncbi:MAG: bifunctional precorrin-2 dehydrogenase/sirohydrochlorin ferrochelatase [Actinobacteria bacterium]|nr:bifunctional precorrin-2 dehydrogenase/sirohydrochlorin ferrochelatase [Actinomycetota bacterium]